MAKSLFTSSFLLLATLAWWLGSGMTPSTNTTAPQNTAATLSNSSPIDTTSAAPASSWPAVPLDANLSLHCISSEGKQIALVGGSVERKGQSQHSALFLTLDGGQHWRSIGPAIGAARIISVHCQGQSIWALGQNEQTELGPFVLRSMDGGQQWQRFDLQPAEHIGKDLQAATLLWLSPEDGVISGMFREQPGMIADFVSQDGGQSWHHCESRPGTAKELALSNSRIESASGWSWRLIDNVIQRRDPATGTWVDVTDQPEDDYQPDNATPAYMVKAQSGTRPLASSPL